MKQLLGRVVDGEMKAESRTAQGTMSALNKGTLTYFATACLQHFVCIKATRYKPVKL